MGDEGYDFDEILSELLKAWVVFVTPTEDGKQLNMFVNCNDIFAWGCADAEPVTASELEDVYKAFKAGPWGPAAWCCKKRNEQPQRPVRRYMKRANEWTPELEALPRNQYDMFCCDMERERLAKSKQP